MRSYTLSAIVASLAGWLVATIVYALGYFIANERQAIEAIKIIAPATFIISVLAHIALVQLPRYFIKKAFSRVGKLTFAINYSVLALLSFTLLFGGSFGSNPVEQLTYLNAATNGFILGLILRSTWKPISLINS